MRRIGIIGIENSHANHFLRHLNVETRFPDATCTTILQGTPERVDELTKTTHLEVLDTPEQFVGAVDAAIICSRDGALHREQAEPLLRAGIPVLIDKPLATSTADAQALVELAAANDVPLLSASAVRFTPEVGELRSVAADAGGLQAVSVTGPADPDSPYSGIFFYGIHTVETAFELIGQPKPQLHLDDLTVLAEPSVTVATLSIDGVAVTLRFVKPDDQGQVPFHAAIFGRHRSSATDLTLGRDYNFPVLEKFITTISGSAPANEPGDLVAPVSVTERIRAVLRPDATPTQENR